MAETVASELAEAEAAAAGPRQQVSVLEQGLRVAIASCQFAQAAAIQADLEPAREALALADARVRALRSAATQLEQERTAAARKIAEARQADEAGRDLVKAQADEAKATAHMEASLRTMREPLPRLADTCARRTFSRTRSPRPEAWPWTRGADSATGRQVSPGRLSPTPTP